jgi:hypothetical protein
MGNTYKMRSILCGYKMSDINSLKNMLDSNYWYIKTVYILG